MKDQGFSIVLIKMNRVAQCRVSMKVLFDEK